MPQAVAKLDRDRQQAAAERRMALSLLNGGRVLARRLVRADSSGGSGSSGERQAEAQLKVSSIGGGSSGGSSGSSSDGGGGAGGAGGTGSEPASGPATGASEAADGGAGQQVVPESQLQGAAAAAALQEGEGEEAELPPPMVRGTADIAPSTCFLQVGRQGSTCVQLCEWLSDESPEQAPLGHSMCRRTPPEQAHPKLRGTCCASSHRKASARLSTPQEEFKGVVAATSGFSWVPARPNAASFNAQVGFRLDGQAATQARACVRCLLLSLPANEVFVGLRVPVSGTM